MGNFEIIFALLVAITQEVTSVSLCGNSSWKDDDSGPFAAVAFIDFGNEASGVYGEVWFSQASRMSKVEIHGEIYKLNPANPDNRHGFHIHECGIGRKNDPCGSTGKHYNPASKNHGAPEDMDRHVGDLGNIECDSSGYAYIDTKDDKISLTGPRSIIGRAVVIHTTLDDLGKGGNEESLKTGNAGARIACGNIVRTCI